jgi:putative oxidoreductase
VVTIFILAMGIILVHGKNGWFVIGGGSNGVEFNLVLIAGFIHFFLSTKKWSE